MFQSEKISPLCKKPASFLSGSGWPYSPATVKIASLWIPKFAKHLKNFVKQWLVALLCRKRCEISKVILNWSYWEKKTGMSLLKLIYLSFRKNLLMKLAAVVVSMFLL